MVASPCQFHAKTSRKRCVHPARSCRRRGGHREELRGSTTQLTAPNEGIFTVFCLLPAALCHIPRLANREHCHQKCQSPKSKIKSPVLDESFRLVHSIIKHCPNNRFRVSRVIISVIASFIFWIGKLEIWPSLTVHDLT